MCQLYAELEVSCSLTRLMIEAKSQVAIANSNVEGLHLPLLVYILTITLSFLLLLYLATSHKLKIIIPLHTSSHIHCR
jgi:hypothetical protein